MLTLGTAVRQPGREPVLSQTAAENFGNSATKKIKATEYSRHPRLPDCMHECTYTYVATCCTAAPMHACSETRHSTCVTRTENGGADARYGREPALSQIAAPKR